MVHVVKKVIGKHIYLYLQKSFHIKGTKKKLTKHVAYLGKAEKYSEEQIKEILSKHNKGGIKWKKNVLRKDANKKGLQQNSAVNIIEKK